MNVLIAYTTKNQATARCAEMLRDMLGERCCVTLCDLKKESAPALSDFDVIVLGASVRFAKVAPAMKAFVKSNLDTLCHMPTALFLCCGYPDNFGDYVKENFPSSWDPSFGVHCFGGEMKPEKLHGIDKWIIKAMRNAIVEHDFEDGFYEGSLPELLPETIQRLADRIRGIQ